MTTKNYSSFSHKDNTNPVASMSVGSFTAKLEDVKQRVEFDYIRREDRRQAEEICMIIAEVESLPSHYDIQIAKDKLPMIMVKEIFSRISHEHIEFVIERFKKQRVVMRNKKSYLRTMLYNSVFELESHYINEVRAGG